MMVDEEPEIPVLAKNVIKPKKPLKSEIAKLRKSPYQTPAYQERKPNKKKYRKKLI